MYFLRISGLIPLNKQMEFEQTFRYVSSMIPESCVNYSLTRDFHRQDAYEFMSYWELQDAMEAFSNSATFRMLKGAFQALGRLNEDRSGLIMDLKI